MVLHVHAYTQQLFLFFLVHHEVRLTKSYKTESRCGVAPSSWRRWCLTRFSAFHRPRETAQLSEMLLVFQLLGGFESFRASRWSWIKLWRKRCRVEKCTYAHTDVRREREKEREMHRDVSAGMLLGGIRRKTPRVCPGIGRRGSCHGYQWKRREGRRGEMAELKNCTWL